MFFQRCHHFNRVVRLLQLDGAERVRFVAYHSSTKEIHAHEFSDIGGAGIQQKIVLAALLDDAASIEYKNGLSKEQSFQVLMRNQNGRYADVYQDMA